MRFLAWLNTRLAVANHRIERRNAIKASEVQRRVEELRHRSRR